MEDENKQKYLFGDVDELRITLEREHQILVEDAKKVQGTINRSKEKLEDLKNRILSIRKAIKNLPEITKEDAIESEEIQTDESSQDFPLQKVE